MLDQNRAVSLPNRRFVPYVLPFAFFGVCTYLTPAASVPNGVAYAVKTLAVAACLFYFRRDYEEEIRLAFDWVGPMSGVFVFLVWILTEGLYPQIGHSQFNPYQYATGSVVYGLIFFRLAGAVLVVPLMEELFWRSFAQRFLIEADFRSVPLGKFTWFSFVVISAAFGFEHHRWLPGILAGMVYGGLLCYSKNLFVPILSHAVTNLLLGIYVLSTGRWSFW